MKIQISQMAKLSGVSIRTLHYYDSIGLLKPAGVDERNGYRYYDERSIEQINRILHYRDMNIALKDIPDLLHSNTNISNKLLSERKALIEKKQRIEQIICNIDAELSKPTKLCSWFDKVLNDYNYSGFSFIGGKEAFFHTWGKADYKSNSSFTMNSRFCAGTITMQFTAFCVLLLEQQGKLSTEEPIKKFIPEFKYSDSVKIAHLLNMTSGISEALLENRFNSAAPDFSKIHDDLGRLRAFHRANLAFVRRKSIDSILKIINYAPLKFLPGVQYDYAEINYELLGYIIERITCMPLYETFKQLIFDPLGMNETSFSGEVDVVGYAGDTAVEITDVCDGAKGIITTVDNLSKWCDALIDRKLLCNRGYEKIFALNIFDFACGFYSKESKYSHNTAIFEVFTELEIDFEHGSYYISVRNKAPLPKNGKRIMYYPIYGCDDGWVKLEVWNMQSGSIADVTSVTIYGSDARQLYCVPPPKTRHFIRVKNDGMERNAADFIADNSYFYELDLSEIMGNCYDRGKTYIIEVIAENCTASGAMLGAVYRRDGEWQNVAYYIFKQYESAYPLFLEALQTQRGF